MFSSIAQEILVKNYIIMAWLLMLWIFKGFLKANDPVYVDTYNYYDYGNRTSKWFALLTIIPLILWAGFRPDVEDTQIYRWWFRSNTEATLDGLKTIISSTEKGKGYSVLNFLVKLVFGNNDVIFFIIASAIIVGIVSYVYRRTTVEYSMAMFLYFISSDFYQWNFNGLRQGIASALIFLASFFLFEKKYFRFVVLMVFAFTIHSASIVFLIALFLFKQPPWSIRTFIIAGGFVLAIMFLGQFNGVLSNILEDTNYSTVVQQFEEDDGVNILRVLVYAIPFILATINYKDVLQENDVIVNFSVNMCLIGVLFYILGVFTSGIYIGRLPIFFTYWNYVLLSWELDRLFSIY